MKKEVAKWNEELDALKTQFEKEKEQWREEEKGMANEHEAKMVEVAKANENEKLRLASERASQDAETCLLYTSPSPRDLSTSRMPSSA